jgi:hypothetical protein
VRIVNFSFDNPQLWRSKKKKYNLELFKPGARNADPLALKVSLMILSII